MAAIDGAAARARTCRAGAGALEPGPRRPAGRGRAAASRCCAAVRGRPRSRAAVEQVGADVVHAHNLNPLFGPRALEAARAAGARVVMHLHNYRLFCAIAIAYRDGASLHALPRPQHAAGRAASLPRQPARGAGLRAPGCRRSRSECWRRSTASSCRATPPRPCSSASGMPADRMDVLHNFLPSRQFARRQQRRRGRARAVRRPAGRGEGTSTPRSRRRRAPGCRSLIAGDGSRSRSAARAGAGSAVCGSSAG